MVADVAFALCLACLWALVLAALPSLLATLASLAIELASRLAFSSIPLILFKQVVSLLLTQTCICSLLHVDPGRARLALLASIHWLPPTSTFILLSSWGSLRVLSRLALVCAHGFSGAYACPVLPGLLKIDIG